MSRGSLWAVARERGITLKSGRDHSPAASRERTTYARKTLRRLMDKHGEEHVGRVLDVILGDERGRRRNREGNAAELYGATLTAVSELLRRHPQLAEEGPAILREIDLGALRRRAKAMKAGPVSQTMLTLLTLALVDTGADEDWMRERTEEAA